MTSIHKLEPGDIELAQHLLALFQRAFELEERTSAPKYLERLLGREDFHAIVALLEGEVIGGLSAYELEMLDGRRELFVYDVAVHEAHRRQGIGRALIHAARELCPSRDISALFVAASADEEHAVRFYEAAGLDREDVAMFTHAFQDRHQQKPQP